MKMYTLLMALFVATYSLNSKAISCLEMTQQKYLDKAQKLESNVSIRNNLVLGGANVIWALGNPVVAAGALAAGAIYVTVELMTKDARKLNNNAIASKEVALKEGAKFIRKLVKRSRKYNPEITSEAVVEILFRGLETGELCGRDNKVPSFRKIKKYVLQEVEFSN